MITKKERYQFRKDRSRRKLLEGGIRRLRLSVYRSDKYIYAQVVDDQKGGTLAAASSLDKELKGKFKSSGKSVETAKIVGSLLAKRAIEKGVKEVCFDRGGRIYHGRIKAFADAAREAGLKF
ncbi:MAG: 50S ribosomal protein L18 [Elusimicrobia bacterium GWC2_51_8]|nr:MAG: 50S ribosomal protein L18 [Elusimicrobia bacterium GWA2_51_34]OGR62458.1 MAG: 50S ribosomal protein L18 [Elusimicrobia bacterium GWC2_51_8]OGR85988.1 MAG: 50S ribosomal protein L18 [Elusimicrobia bacterium GWF2_52_66]HAF96450.1 50S ribosomal protein L18 [Elusimicrobiota bacterium]HCE97286.1 50S ribosomal protein L18 [Elusimicrobiota bacterium]